MSFPTSQLMSEIDRVSVQKQLNLLNKTKLFEAAQGLTEPFKNFVFRLQLLAYECNFTTSCSSQDCTAANSGGNILFAMVRGLAIQSEMLLNRDHVGIEPKPAGDIEPGASLNEDNTSQYKKLDAAAPEFYPEGNIGESTTAKDKPRMRVILTLETCLDKIVQKECATRKYQDWTHITTRNSLQVPGQTNRHNRSE